MKKVKLKDILKKGKTLDDSKIITQKEIDESVKYLKKKFEENDRLRRIDPHTGDLFVGN